MKPTFDLVHEPWVPCIRADGTSTVLGLRDVLVQAHQLRELHGESPLVIAAVHRLLLAVLHRVFGPAGPSEWSELWEAGRWDAESLDDYLTHWHSQFDLFDAERPFFQAADQRVKPKSVGSLIHQVASGNNPTLFDHHTDGGGVSLTPAEAARMLVAAQAYGLGGLSGLPQKFIDGPCASGILFLVQGETLFETLALNLLPYPTDESTMPHDADDRPAWEMDDPFVPERSHPKGYLDYLTWQNRRVLFEPEGAQDGIAVRRMTVAPALRMDSSVLDPMTHYRLDPSLGPRPLGFREERSLWRDSAALFRPKDQGQRRVVAFDWLSELIYEEDVLSRHQTRRLLALGMSKKQAKVFFYRAERMPLPVEYLRDEELVQALEKALQMAEGAARKLWGAARTLANFSLSPDADAESGRQPAREDLDQLTEQWAVERRFWSQLEVPFRETMESLPKTGETALEGWRAVLSKAAWNALDQVTDNLDHDPSKLKAVVRARDQLAAGLAKVLPK